MKKNKNTGFVIMSIFLIVIMGFFVMSKNVTTIDENNIEPKGDAQIVKLSVQGGNYIMTPSTLKKDIPVRIEADMTKMPGCSKSIVISAFNVRKTLTEGDNIMEFTPNKAGTFNIACSMNMYKGSFTVLESDGTKPVYIEPASTVKSSCGMAGGGCGCGG